MQTDTRDFITESDMPNADIEERKKYQKDLRTRWIEDGRCSMCGVGEAIPNRRVCSDCKERYKKRHRDLKLRVIKGYGNKCACCGETNFEFLSVDHIKERGADERRRLGRGAGSTATVYRMLIRLGFPDSHQCLCYNCNMSLGFYGYRPHRPENTREVYRVLSPQVI